MIGTFMTRLLSKLWHMPILLFCGALLCWAGNAVFTRITMLSVDAGPIQLSFWRTLIGFGVVSLLALPQIRRDWSIIWREWPVLSFLGISSLVAYNLLLYFGLASGEEAPAASTIASIFPLVIVVIGILFFGERLSPLAWMGVALAVLGGLIAAFEGSITKALTFELSTGKLWLLGAVLGYGIYMACVRLRPKNIGDFCLVWAFLFWALAFLSILWVWDSLVRGNSFPWHEPGALANLAYLVLAPTLAAPILVNQSIKIGGAQTPGVMMNTIPFLVAALSAVVGIFIGFSEALKWYHWLSLAFIVPGAVLIQLKK